MDEGGDKRREGVDMNMLYVGLCAFLLNARPGLDPGPTLASSSFSLLRSINLFCPGVFGKVQNVVLSTVETCKSGVMNSQDIILTLGSVLCFLFFILMTSATIMVGAFYLGGRTINSSLSEHQKNALHKFTLLFRVHVVVVPILIVGVIWLFLTSGMMRIGLIFMLLGLIQLPVIMYMMTKITH